MTDQPTPQTESGDTPLRGDIRDILYETRRLDGPTIWNLAIAIEAAAQARTEALDALRLMREFAEHDTHCLFACDLSGINGDEWAGDRARPCSCGFDKALALYEDATR